MKTCRYSDNASSQYKNKHAFAFYQKLADNVGLRIIQTFGAAGHGKGAIDGMSRFGVENILRQDIVTQDIFFNDWRNYRQLLCPKEARVFLYACSCLGSDD